MGVSRSDHLVFEGDTLGGLLSFGGLAAGTPQQRCRVAAARRRRWWKAAL